MVRCCSRDTIGGLWAAGGPGAADGRFWDRPAEGRPAAPASAAEEPTGGATKSRARDRSEGDRAPGAPRSSRYDVVVGKISFLRPKVGVFFLCPEVGLEYSISTSGRSRRTRSRRRSSQSSGVNRRRSILHIRSWTHSKTCAPPQPQREREFRTILIRPLDTSKLKF